jgi:hypothetical protein
VIAVVTKLKVKDDDARALVNFCDLVCFSLVSLLCQISYAQSKVLKGHFLTSNEKNKALALLSTLMHSVRFLPKCYLLPVTIQHNRAPIGNGAFGTAHCGYDSNLCIKATNFATLNSNADAVRNNFQFLIPWTCHKVISAAMVQSTCSVGILVASKHFTVLWRILQESDGISHLPIHEERKLM